MPLNVTTRRIYIQFENDPSKTEIENICKNYQEGAYDLKVFPHTEKKFILGISL